jgi:YHS domain-containing protein
MGRPYYFCAAACEKVFEAESEKYLDPEYKAHM